MFLKNGSFMLGCHEECNVPSVGNIGTYFETSLTTNWTHGPYVRQCLNVVDGSALWAFNGSTHVVANEDPVLYQDWEGNLHMLTHNQYPCYSGDPRFGADVRGCGAHFFSGDSGSTWSFTPHAAYNGTARFANGDSVRYKRERPKVWLDADDHIVAVYNGASTDLVDAFEPGGLDSACTLVAPTPWAAA